jgi:hydrogenase maturation protein HypF
MGSSPLCLLVLNSSTKHKHTGVKILIRGTVQGVGFRPFIYNLASRFSVTGTVTNSGDGVVIEAVAENDRLNAFIKAISENQPPLSHITSVDTSSLLFDAVPKEFSILTSITTDTASTGIPPDSTLCIDCYDELTDPSNRRFRYPFINCTNCGPRFTIVESIPYDRPKTSMKTFAMCSACEQEYHDPANRRFHAQPNGCPECGPEISWHKSDGDRIVVEDVIAAAAENLSHGKVIAIRGLGGFHLAVDGCSESAVSILRKRKNRPHKPLAIMVASPDLLKEYCHFSKTEERLLLSQEHPIVLLKRKAYSKLAPNLAPGIDDIGVMLPYTPLHYLLLEHKNCPAALVMSSGNVSGVPICTANKDALERLESVADFFLLHNRDIVTRVDDSVVKIIDHKPIIFRRARGFVPSPTWLPWHLPKILGCGAELKNTFCLGRDKSSFLSQHIGDLSNLESYDFYIESIEHLKGVFQLEPEVVACDLHPDYMSSRYAENVGLPLYRIQHHHAHAVAVMAEHGLDKAVLAVIMDGSGYGPDGTVWGGEILRADLTSYSRLGHLSHLHLPGGDSAAIESWRMALSALYTVYGEEALQTAQLPPSLQYLNAASVEIVRAMLDKKFNVPLTSSCGRLFDAVASLLGICQYNSYEGQAAIELEAVARKAVTRTWIEEILPVHHKNGPPLLLEKNGKWEISSRGLIKIVYDDIIRGNAVSDIALKFHALLINTTTELIQKLSRETGIVQVVLSGGCMQNSLLLEGLLHTLGSKNIQVYTGNMLPVNDGAISFGQAVAGGLQHLAKKKALTSTEERA